MSEHLSEAVLRIRDLHVTRGRNPVLRGVDLDARPGRVHVVLGASGSGKSTLLRACIGLVPRPSDIRADILELNIGHDSYDLLSKASRAAVRGNHIGLVGQDPALDLTPLRRVGSLVTEAVGGGQTTVATVLERCGLPARGLQRRMCFQLSGGMAQRLALGLAGARNPELLLADEPSTALDAIARGVLSDHLRTVADTGSAVVLVTHDVGFATGIADDVTVLDRGSVVEEGKASDVLHRPEHPSTKALVCLSSPQPSTPGTKGQEPDALVVRGLTAAWNRHRILDGLDLRVARGEVLGIVGRSGAGKSTLVACLTGLLTASAGTIEIAGRTSSDTQWRELRRYVQLIPQDPRGSLNPWRSVADQVRDPLDVHRVGTRAERDARVRELLVRVGLDGLGERRPGMLSTGQCQRVAIARALAIRPAVLIADEPVTALDTGLRAEILELFDEVVREDDIAAVVISHDLYVLEYLSDRVAVLDDGHIVEELSAVDLRSGARHPLTRALVAAYPPLRELQADGLGNA